MAKTTRFEDYRDRYPNVRFEKSPDGVLLMQLHTDGQSLHWNTAAHDALPDALADVAGDRDLSVVILTGTGDDFLASYGTARAEAAAESTRDLGAEYWDHQGWTGRNRHLHMLDVQVPMIAAVNGPVTIHSELPIMCDIVLASEEAYFQDSAHFPRGIVPGDGVHTVWPIAIGRNRARYFLLTGQKISARQALDWGAVNEVLPKDQVLNRAFELAHQLAKCPPLTLRMTRAVLVQEFRRAAVNDLSFAQIQELYGLRHFFPIRRFGEPLDRSWDDPDLFADDEER